MMQTNNKVNQMQKYQNDISNITTFKQKMMDMYTTELNETIDRILLKPEGEFMRALTNRFQILLSKEYSEEIYEDCTLVSLLRTVEKEVYLHLYKPLKEIFNKIRKEKGESQSNSLNQYYSFRKHCNYQSNSILHKCIDGKITSTFIHDNANANAEYLICSKCNIVNRLSCAKLYCNFCSIEYYTTLTNINHSNTEESELDPNLQPATWDKYHCNIVFNDQMKCIQCKAKLFLNTTDNELKCIKCGFHSESMAILWKCIICAAEFRSNAKIYNPLEYKMFKTSIKEALVKKVYAKPERFPCLHQKMPEVMTHKANCDGKLLIGYYNDSKMVICDKCNVATLYNKFIWTCSICSRRFREAKSDKKLLNSIYDDDTISYTSSTYDSWTFYNDKGNSINHKRANEGSNSSIDKNSNNNNNNNSNANVSTNSPSHGLELKNKLKKIMLLPSITSMILMPMINLDDYLIISEIAEGASSKVYAVKDSNNQFYALKRQHYDIGNNSNDTHSTVFEGYKLHYSMKSPDIVQVEGYSIDKYQNELCILEELGLCDLEKEIVSRKRIKRYYSEPELMNMLYQITSALCYLQLNGFVHWNICPYNIIAFKEGAYKLCDFASMRRVDENQWDKADNYFTPPSNQTVDMIKADVYCLGLTMIYASTLTYQPIEDIIALNYSQKNLRPVNEQLRAIVNANLPKERYSDQYIDLILGMIEADVKERMDFLNVYDYITKEYNKP